MELPDSPLVQAALMIVAILLGVGLVVLRGSRTGKREDLPGLARLLARGKYEQAGNLAARYGRLEDAIEYYLRAQQPIRAAHVAVKLSDARRAAELFERAGESERAAFYYEQADMGERAHALRKEAEDASAKDEPEERPDRATREEAERTESERRAAGSGEDARSPGRLREVEKPSPRASFEAPSARSTGDEGAAAPRSSRAAVPRSSRAAEAAEATDDGYAAFFAKAEGKGHAAVSAKAEDQSHAAASAEAKDQSHTAASAEAADELFRAGDIRGAADAYRDAGLYEEAINLYVNLLGLPEEAAPLLEKTGNLKRAAELRALAGQAAQQDVPAKANPPEAAPATEQEPFSFGDRVEAPEGPPPSSSPEAPAAPEPVAGKWRLPSFAGRTSGQVTMSRTSGPQPQIASPTDRTLAFGEKARSLVAKARAAYARSPVAKRRQQERPGDEAKTPGEEAPQEQQPAPEENGSTPDRERRAWSPPFSRTKR